MVYGDRYPDDVAGRRDGRRSPAGVQQAVCCSPPEGDRRRARGLHQARADADFEKDPSRNPEGLDLIKSAAQAEASPGFGDRPLAS